MSGYTTPQTRLTIAALTGLANARSAHSLAAGLAIGSNVWGSLIQGVIAYKNLPRQQFGNLQAKTFPVYFSFTSYVSGFMLVNWLHCHPGAFREMLDLKMLLRSDVANAWLLAAGCLGTSLVNWLVVLPWTSSIMYKRHKLERSEGKSEATSAVSTEMKALNSQFGVAHGTSSILNLAFLGAMSIHVAWVATYGF